jgi:hypothetical protein
MKVELKKFIICRINTALTLSYSVSSFIFYFRFEHYRPRKPWKKFRITSLFNKFDPNAIIPDRRNALQVITEQSTNLTNWIDWLIDR